MAANLFSDQDKAKLFATKLCQPNGDGAKSSIGVPPV